MKLEATKGEGRVVAKDDNANGKNFDIPYNSDATITAVPNNGYEFVGWYKGIPNSEGVVDSYDPEVSWSTSSTTLSIGLYENTAVYALFKKQVKLTLVGSAIDSNNVAEPYVTYISPDSRVYDLDNDTREAIIDHFSTKGYFPYRDSIYITSEPLSKFSSWDAVDDENYTYSGQNLTEDTTFYLALAKRIDSMNFKVEKPICGTEVTLGENSQTNAPVVTATKNPQIKMDDFNEMAYWIKADTQYPEPFEGTIEGGQSYSVVMMPRIIDVNYGYDINVKKMTINVENADKGSAKIGGFGIQFNVTADHNWDNGKVTKQPTKTTEGVKTFTCSVCGATKTEPIAKLKPTPAPAPGSDPNQKGADGTAVGPGASAACADKAITSMKSDNDPAGSKFAPLKLKSTKQGKKNIKLTWTKAKGATSYVVYGNTCGTKNRFKKLTTVKTNKYNVKKVSKKLKKGTYYKFIVVALDKNNNVVSTSKIAHVATTGGKVGNNKSVTVTKKVVNKAKKLKKGKTLKLKAKAIAKSKDLKVKKHRSVRYESTNTKIATVSKAGVVKAKKKGTCYIYAYAQNGVSKKIKVTVK